MILHSLEEIINPVTADCEFGKSILQKEAQALLTLSEQLSIEFTRCIDCLYKISGKIIVTGMGKSGLVGKKIAATLSSTGSPAFFIHPGEASHGDLGMIGEDDALIVLSYSGNTAELSNIIRYAKGMGVPIIGVTRDSKSMVGTFSDYHLNLPNLPEADVLDCAPTTPTTMQMALGDAIAVCLMKKRGIEIADFHRWHPGGTLGQKLYLVRDIMHSSENLPLISPDALMSEAIVVMSSKGFGIIGVIEGDNLVGVITDGDLRRHMHPELLNKMVSEVMTRSALTLKEDRLAEEALQLMRSKKITSLFVMKEERPVGIVHIHDLLKSGAKSR